MKTWHIYTIIGFTACITAMQTLTTYLAVQSMNGSALKAAPHPEKKELNKQLNELTTTYYYWRIIPKDELTEEYVQTEIDNDDLVKNGSVDRMTVEENLHRLLGPISDEEYVGTLYETDHDIIIVTKKTETHIIGPNDSFYTDPNDPDPFNNHP